MSVQCIITMFLISLIELNPVVYLLSRSTRSNSDDVKPEVASRHLIAHEMDMQAEAVLYSVA